MRPPAPTGQAYWSFIQTHVVVDRYIKRAVLQGAHPCDVPLEALLDGVANDQEERPKGEHESHQADQRGTSPRSPGRSQA
jgi:hypothetical protein